MYSKPLSSLTIQTMKAVKTLADRTRLEREFKQELKCAKRCIEDEDYGKASSHLQVATLEYVDRMSEARRKVSLGLIYHRRAEVAVAQGEIEAARMYFDAASERMSPKDLMANARLLRDYGNFLRLEGCQQDLTRGRAYVEKALRLLESDEANERARIEIVVTEAFRARFLLEDPRQKKAAIKILRETAVQLHSYKKLAYELANLRILIAVLPIYSPARAKYIQRGITACLAKGKFRKAGEFSAMSYGRHARSTYNFIVR